MHSLKAWLQQWIPFVAQLMVQQLDKQLEQQRVYVDKVTLTAMLIVAQHKMKCLHAEIEAVANSEENGRIAARHLSELHHELTAQLNAANNNDNTMKIRPPPGASHNTTKISLPLGSALVRLVSLLPARNGLRRAITEVVADMREEHYEALRAGDTRQARWIAIRGRVTAVWTGLSYLGLRVVLAKLLGEMIGKIFKAGE